MVWCISDDLGCGYCSYKWRKNHSVVIGAWRTEDEVKQVVAAFRQIFGGVFGRSDDAVNAVRGGK